MPQTRTVLSLEPNSLMAKFLTAGGVWLIDSSPTASTGAPIGELRMAATSWATPSATSAVTMPTSAPAPSAGQRSAARCRADAPGRGEVALLRGHTAYSYQRAGRIALGEMP